MPGSTPGLDTREPTVLNIRACFSRQEIRNSGALDEDSVDAVLSAETLDGTEVFRLDSVRIVLKKKK